MSTNTTKNKRRKTSSSSSTTSVNSKDSSQPQTLQQSWPKNNPATKQFPKGALLHNLDQYIWDAISHIDPQLFNAKDKRKQVAIREALNFNAQAAAVFTGVLDTCEGLSKSPI